MTIYRGSTTPGQGSIVRGNADEIDIEDAGNIITATNVEDALQEIKTEVDGLGTASLEDTGTSGATVPLLSTANTWTLAQDFTANGATFPTGTWSPTVSAVTPGDLSVSYSTQSGRWMKIGNRYFFEVVVAFTPTYTTASGALTVSNAFTAAQLVRGAVGFTNNVTFNASAVIIGWVARTDGAVFRFSQSASGAAAGTLNIETAIPSGTTATLTFNGQFEV